MDRNLGSPPGLWWCGWDGGYSFFCGVWLECSNYYIKVIYLLGCLFLILWFESMSLIGVFLFFCLHPLTFLGCWPFSLQVWNIWSKYITSRKLITMPFFGFSGLVASLVLSTFQSLTFFSYIVTRVLSCLYQEE